MAVAILAYLDAASDRAIRSIWQQLAEAGSAPRMYASGIRPHLTLAAYESIDAAACEQRLMALNAAVAPMPLTLAYLGAFPTSEAVVFAGPTVTRPLLDLHARVHDALADIGVKPAGHYVPGRWVPHCTLALDFALDQIPQVVEVARRLALPLEGRIEEIGLIEFLPIRQLFAIRLYNAGSQPDGGEDR